MKSRLKSSQFEVIENKIIRGQFLDSRAKTRGIALIKSFQHPFVWMRKIGLLRNSNLISIHKFTQNEQNLVNK